VPQLPDLSQLSDAEKDALIRALFQQLEAAERGPPRNWGSSGNRGWRGYVIRWAKLLSEVETECAIVDGATNLKQEVRAAS
jgi:hypothetical protein